MFVVLEASTYNKLVNVVFGVVGIQASVAASRGMRQCENNQATEHEPSVIHLGGHCWY
jgi:hypothetical protein